MAKDFNHPDVVGQYDDHIRKLIPGYDLIHEQIYALLKNHVVTQANVLVVGCGTGYEIQYLAQQFPLWTFTAIDPAPNMIAATEKRLQSLGLSSRVKCIVADTASLKEMNITFDVALAVLVSHFVEKPKKAIFFQDIAYCLTVQGVLVSVDLTQFEAIRQLACLKTLVIKNGLNQQQAEMMGERITQDFALVSPNEMIEFYQYAGFSKIDIFTQVFNYFGFIGIKT